MEQAAVRNVILTALLLTVNQAQQFPCNDCFCEETWTESELQVQNDTEFGSALNKVTNQTEALLLNVYQPPASDKRTLRPAILSIHGGGFKGNNKDKSEFVAWAKHFAARGFVAVSINYRCERKDGIEIANLDAMYDARAAVRWLVQNREKLRIDTHRIAAFGGSAGGMTVAYMTAVPGEGESGNPGHPSNITAGVSLSGFLLPDQVQHVQANDPPYVDFHGTSDTTVPFILANATKTAMDSAGAVNFLVPLPAQKHVPFPALEKHTGDVMGFLTKYMSLSTAQCPQRQTDEARDVILV